MFGLKMPWTKRKERKEAEERLNIELLRRSHLRLVGKPGMRGDTRHTDTSAPHSYSGGSDDVPYFASAVPTGLVEIFTSRLNTDTSMTGSGGTFDGGGSSGDWSNSSNYSSGSSSDSSSCSFDSSSSSSDSSSSCGSDN